MAKKEELEKAEFPKELIHEESGAKVTALNDIQEAAYKNEGFKEVEE
jgi:hypothetical protein